MDKDIAIICSQTGIKLDKAKELFIKNNNDIVNTILEIEGHIDNKKETKNLTTTQLKIAQLREIADTKDELLETKIKSNNEDI